MSSCLQLVQLKLCRISLQSSLSLQTELQLLFVRNCLMMQEFIEHSFVSCNSTSMPVIQIIDLFLTDKLYTECKLSFHDEPTYFNLEPFQTEQQKTLSQVGGNWIRHATKQRLIQARLDHFMIRRQGAHSLNQKLLL